MEWEPQEEGAHAGLRADLPRLSTPVVGVEDKSLRLEAFQEQCPRRWRPILTDSREDKRIRFFEVGGNGIIEPGCELLGRIGRQRVPCEWGVDIFSSQGTEPVDGHGRHPIVAGVAPSSRQPLRIHMGRALRRRCPHCGEGAVFTGWWKMRDHCPKCGHKFEREPGYWVGAVIFNTALAIAAIFATMAIFLAASWPDVPWTALTVATVAVSVIVPSIGYPYARTLWMAYDLYVHPLEEREIEAGRARAASVNG